MIQETLADVRKGGSKALMVFVMALALVYGGLMVFKKSPVAVKGGSSAAIDSSAYQAVFLTNGQSYFGKVSNPEGQYVSMNDVYYLMPKQASADQNGNDIQDLQKKLNDSSLSAAERKSLTQELKDKKESAAASKGQIKPEYSLVKLGKEMYGPKDMMINRDQIVLIENLNNDSQVVKTIHEGVK